MVFAGDASGSGEAVSGGFDSTIRKWDVENGVHTTTIVSFFLYIAHYSI